MAFLAVVRDNLLVRASVATVAGFVLLGVASGALPVQCFTGIAACRAVEDAAKLNATGDAPVPAPAVVQVALNEPQAPTLTRNDVIAGTFATLKVDLQALQPGELIKRIVKTVAIGPDGMPITKAAPVPAPVEAITEVQTAQAELVASSEPPPLRSVATDATPLAYVPSKTPAPAQQSSAEAATSEIATADPVAPPKAKLAGKTAVVKGGGVNVRSAPSKAKSKVLFALAPGAVVTVGSNERGWLKITDAKGRSGWVYQDFVSRQ